MTAFIEKLHATKLKCVLYTTGGGASVLQALTAVPGCSGTLLQGVVPYSFDATASLLDHRPKKMVCQEVSRDLAYHAWLEAKRLTPKKVAEEGPTTSYLVGVGATCAIQTTRTRRGEDAIFVSTWQEQAGGLGIVLRDYHLQLSKERSRVEQEELIQTLILRALGNAVRVVDRGPDFDVPLPLSPVSDLPALEGERLAEEVHTTSPPLSTVTEMRGTSSPDSIGLAQVQGLLDGKLPSGCVLFNSFGAVRADAPPHFSPESPAVECVQGERKNAPEEGAAAGGTTSTSSIPTTVQLLFPGSFNPLHYGHIELAAAAATVATRRHTEKLGMVDTTDIAPTPVVVTYELALTRVGKGSISAVEAMERVRQFTSTRRRVAVSTAKLFVDKCKLFPGHGFVVGYDTMVRILDPQYYPAVEHQQEQQVEELTADGNKVGVAAAVVVTPQEQGLIRAMDEIVTKYRCYFLVGGRKADDGSDAWLGCEDLAPKMAVLPQELRHKLVFPISKEEFQIDISSTELRKRRGAPRSSPKCGV